MDYSKVCLFNVEKNTSTQGSTGSGLFGMFSGLFAKKDDQPDVPKAHLPSGSSFYFDPELKKWVNKNASSTSAEESKPAAPPILAKKPELTNPGGPPMGGGPPRNSKRGARSKYVDVINPNSAAEQVAPVNSFMPAAPQQTHSAKPMMVRCSNLAYPRESQLDTILC